MALKSVLFQVHANGELYKARVIRGLFTCERYFYDANSVWNGIYEIRVSINVDRGYVTSYVNDMLWIHGGLLV